MQTVRMDSLPLPLRFLRQLAPPARKPATWSVAAPLLGFLIVFVALVVILEWRGILRFTRPWAFALLVFTPWIWWMNHAGGSGLSGARSIFALLVRLALAGTFAMALAEPRAVRKSDVLSIVYALDVSDSMGEKVSDQSLGWIMQSVTKKPEKDEAGLVIFGRDAAVELPPRATFPFETINSRVARDGSNLAKGLSLAAAMLPEGNQGRVVLISDGNETDGAAAAQLDELKARGIPVDVLPITYGYEKEVWLERLDLPRVVKAGETYEASVVLSALTAGAGKMTLQENGKTIFEKEVDYAAGKNRFTLPLYLREPGYYEYLARIEPAKGEDGWAENNVAIGDVYLKGEGKVLVVTDAKGDARDWETLVAALKGAERVVQEQMAYEFPRDALSLLPYDLVIFPNVPADSFDAVQLTALRDAVYQQGTGFLMLGGPNSYGPGGYHRSVIEEALPVTMDTTQKKVLPKGALAVILHTCEFAEGNTWAKRIAKECVRVLGAQDEVGILQYSYGSPHNGMGWIFPLTPASEYDRLAVLINNAEPGDMPDFQTGMQMAFNALKASDAAVKHTIVISDGDPSPPTPQLVQAYVDAKITVSMVAINPHGGQDISVMQTVAAATGGRYYFPQDPKQLPSIFIKEAKTLKRSMLQNKLFTPQVEFPSPILKGFDALPQLRGLVLTTVKPRASLILRAPPGEGEEADQVDPVLATWRFGLGMTCAWTSDLAPNWAADWIGWEKYRAFVKQLATEISRVEMKTDLQMHTFANGAQGIVTIEDFAKADTFLELAARVSGPRGENVTVPLRQTGPRRYQGEFPLWGKGRYQVMAAGADASRNEQAFGGFAVPYSPEYLRFRSDPILLKQITERTGGRLLTGAETDLFHPPRTARESSRPVFDWFLIALALLLPLDVAVRRVQLDWTVILAWFGRGPMSKTSTETMGALLQRKQKVKETMDAPRTEAPPPLILPKTLHPQPRAEPAKPSTEAPPPAADTTPQSTTERLLARKRKRQEGDEKP
jgi:Ca-activated chloride channel homolog